MKDIRKRAAKVSETACLRYKTLSKKQYSEQIRLERDMHTHVNSIKEEFVSVMAREDRIREVADSVLRQFAEEEADGAQERKSQSSPLIPPPKRTLPRKSSSPGGAMAPFS